MMTDFKPNEYIELYNPGKNNYFPIRILSKNENGYEVMSLRNNKKINISNYYLTRYGYKRIWVSEELLSQLGFKKEGLIYSFENTIIVECLIGEVKIIDHPYYLYEYNSNHLGYAILKKNEIEAFLDDYKKIDFNASNHPIKEKYKFTSLIDEVFAYLIEQNTEELNYEKLDEIIFTRLEVTRIQQH